MIKVGLERLITQGRIWLESAYFKITAISAVDEDFTSDNPTPDDGTFYLYGKDNGSVAAPYWRDSDGVEHEIGTAGGGGGVTDHGALTGLSDDDHPQYVLRSILTTNGDLFTRLAGAIARLGIGSNGQVLTVSSSLPSWQTPANSIGSAWSVLTNGDPAFPELLFDSNGDVVMTETLR